MKISELQAAINQTEMRCPEKHATIKYQDCGNGCTCFCHQADLLDIADTAILRAAHAIEREAEAQK